MYINARKAAPSYPVIRSDLDVPATAGESYFANFASFRFLDSSDSYDRALRSTLEAGLKRLDEIQGNEATGLEALPMARRDRDSLSPGQIEGRYRANENLIRSLQDPLIPTYDEAIESAKIRALELEQEAGRVNARSHGLAAVAGFAGTMSAAMLDPVNIVTLPLGASAAASALMKMGVQGLINAGTELAIQSDNDMRQALDMPRTGGEIAADVGAAAVGGVLFEGVGLALAKGWRRLRGAGLVEANRAADVAAEILEDAERVQRANPTPDVPGTARPHMERMQAATEAVIHGELPSSEPVAQGVAMRPRTLTEDVASEPGYAYHATNEERLQEIADSGALLTHRPSDFTDQDVWPDGSTKKRAYFSARAATTAAFAPEEGRPVILRRADKGLKRESGTGDLFTAKKTPSAELEFLGEDGRWHPVEGLRQPEPEPDLGDAIRAKDAGPGVAEDPEIAAAAKAEPEADAADAKDAGPAGDSAEPEVDPEVQQALDEHGDMLVGTGEVDAEGKPYMKTLREVLADTDESRSALDAIRNCMLGGG